MSGFCLKIPDYTMLSDISNFRQEFLDYGDEINGSSNLKNYSDPKKWLDSLTSSRENKKDSDGNPPSFQCVYVREEDNSVVGMIQYRNNLVSEIVKNYGNIGYCIRPAERRKGYAKRMLSDMLIKCSCEGIKKLLLLCNAGNEGSKRVILANGGVFDSVEYSEKEDVNVEKYWINL